MAGFADEFKTADFKTEKHVPAITLMGAAAKDTVFGVEVSVGKEVAHPNTSAHFIAWVALYFKPASGPVVELGRADFSAHGASAQGADSVGIHTQPSAVFQIKLDQPGTLLAASYCNIHGLWESQQDISF